MPDQFGAISALFALLSYLGDRFDHLGPPWAVLVLTGASLGPSRASGKRLRRPGIALLSYLGNCFDHLGPPWAVLGLPGASLGSSRASGKRLRGPGSGSGGRGLKGWRGWVDPVLRAAFGVYM